MKKIFLSVLALVAVAALAITGTIAYLQYDDSDVNVMTLGEVKIVQHEYQRAENVSHKNTKDNPASEGQLIAFDQNQPIYPAVPYGDMAEAYQAEQSDLFWWGYYTNNVGGNGLWDDAKLSNVRDKIVIVENTGKSDAYYRTFIAVECPEGMTVGDNYAGGDEIMLNQNGHDLFKWEKLGFVELDGKRYYVESATYTDPLKPGEISRPSLLQVVLTHNATNEDMEALGGDLEILVFSQAVQTAGFENADQALTRSARSLTSAEIALNTAYGAPKENNDKGELNLVAWSRETVAEYAASLVDTWDGTADTSWYNENETMFELTSAEQLAGLAVLVDEGNTFAGKTVKLGRDLDLKVIGDDGEPVSFNPIGYGYNVVFKGTFDGQGNTISNLYQNGWNLGLDYSTEGGGLFASVVDATLKNLTIDNAEVVMECIDMGIVVGYSYGNTNYENILVKNSTIGNYERYTGGVVGEVNGTQTFKNVDVIDTVIASMWGDFDSSLGGIIGGKWGEAQLTFVDCDVDCRLDAYNDATSADLWFAYRRAGMLIGNSEETKVVDDTTVATADYLTCVNCTVTYREWAKYTYCEFSAMAYPYVRVQGGYRQSDYSNPRYGHPTDANGNKVVDAVHAHNDGEDHHVELTLDQLFGGGRGVYGTATHEGVTVYYNY